MTETTRTKDYSEPSASTVELDAPAWLNLDEIISYDERQRIKDLIEEGRELLLKAAQWGRDAVPLTIHSWPESTHRYDDLAPILDRVCAIDELERLCKLFTIAAGSRYDIDNDLAKRMRDEHPELGLHSVENDDEPSKNPMHDTLEMLLECGYAIVRPDGRPFQAGDQTLVDLNPRAAEAAARLAATKPSDDVEVLDEVRCRRLVIVDEHGRERITAGRRGFSGVSIEIEGEDDATSIHLGVSNDPENEGGAASVSVDTKDGTVVLFAAAHGPEIGIEPRGRARTVLTSAGVQLPE
jgi:hypothetical protein